MRDIKFRAWDKKTKKMRQVVEVVWNTGLYLEPNDNTVKLIWVKGYDCIEQKDIMMKREKGFELMQFTGLHDKNGTEIYEGDICKFDGDIYANVVYSEEKGSYAFALKTDDGIWYEEFAVVFIDRVEVVGNIYDNPELLGE